MWVRSLGREDPLEEGMVTLSSTLAWEMPWMEEPGGLQSMGSQRVGHDGRDLAQHSNHQMTVPCSQKDTGEPILKALTFKAMTLSIHRERKSCRTENNICLDGSFQEHHDLTYEESCKNKDWDTEKSNNQLHLLPSSRKEA